MIDTVTRITPSGPSLIGFTGKILVIDDEEVIRILLDKSLRMWGLEVTSFSSGNQALDSFQNGQFDIAIIDLRMPGLDGIEVLKRLKQSDPDIDVILMTAFGSIESAVEALKNGAIDYLTKPLNIDYLKLIIERCLKSRQERRQIEHLQTLVDHHQTYGKLVGVSPSMQKVYQLIEKISQTDTAVLIQGETGTGKELVAREIHLRSRRNGNRFVALSCVTVPETLLESELFGYEPGAFTGASKRKIGLIETAHNGTLFLDEISEIPLSFQTKLLRVVEGHGFSRLGSTEHLNSNFRLITATNRNIKEQISKKAFREDLFYRINVVSIKMPPLRERIEDIPILLNHFLRQLNEERENKIGSAKGGSAEGTGQQKEDCIREISIEAMLLLIRYNWPGNVRELEHIIERAISLDTDQIITPQDLPEEIHKGQKEELKETDISFITAVGSLQDVRDKAEKEYIKKVLKQTKGNISIASQIAGLSRAQLHLKLRRHKINVDKFRA
ncbi:MAG: sigma-54 dependent transcriptional regulator [Planctomycetota bacterium]